MIKEVRDVQVILAAGHLFDERPQQHPTERFVNSPDHHVLIAYDGDRPLGMVTGVELTHPDKGTEMFVYELGVDDAARGRGIGTALVRALADLARGRGCYAMWVATDAGNTAALGAYRKAGATVEEQCVVLTWNFETQRSETQRSETQDRRP